MERRDFIKKTALGVAGVAVAATVPTGVMAIVNNDKKKTNKAMKKILILNGSPRKNGRTASLKNAFVEGAQRAGHEIKEYYLTGMIIRPCLACEYCQLHDGVCVQKDDMVEVTEAFGWADVVVFVSPQFWGTISGQLKVVIDRLYAPLFKYGSEIKKEFVVIMTSRGDMYEMTEDFFRIFTKYLGWKNPGNILGGGKELQAELLGASI